MTMVSDHDNHGDDHDTMMTMVTMVSCRVRLPKGVPACLPSAGKGFVAKPTGK